MSGSTFNLPADLCEVSHPLEDFRVSCLVPMRRLERHQEGRRPRGRDEKPQLPYL